MNRIIKKQEEYLDKKINGHGATYTTRSNGRVVCDWIYGKNKLQILFINIKLWLIWRCR